MLPKVDGARLALLNAIAGADTAVVEVGTRVVAVYIAVQVTSTITTAGTLILRTGGSGGLQVYPSMNTGTAVNANPVTYSLGPDGILMDGLYLDITAAVGGAGLWYVYYR